MARSSSGKYGTFETYEILDTYVIIHGVAPDGVGCVPKRIASVEELAHESVYCCRITGAIQPKSQCQR